MKSTMLRSNNNKGNQTILDTGVYKGQKVDVKGIERSGTVKSVDFVKETITIEIEVSVYKVLEAE